jgi:hypothetical protein
VNINRICIQWKDGQDEIHEIGELFKSHYFKKHAGLKSKYVTGRLVAIDVNDLRVRYTIQSDEAGLVFEMVPMGTIEFLAYVEAGSGKKL